MYQERIKFAIHDHHGLSGIAYSDSLIPLFSLYS